jgi:hypothetical protein
MQLKPEYKDAVNPAFRIWYAENFTRHRMAYVHWEVCSPKTNDPVYHQVIDLTPEGAPQICHNSPVSVDMHAHTFGRNTDSYAIAFAGFDDAATNNLGKDVATPPEIRMMVASLALNQCILRSPVANIMTHGEAANNVDQGPNPPYNTPGLTGDDALPYGNMVHEGPHACERWDNETYIAPDSLKLWAFDDPRRPKTSKYFPDWLRGNVYRAIEDLTRDHWSGVNK